MLIALWIAVSVAVAAVVALALRLRRTRGAVDRLERSEQSAQTDAAAADERRRAMLDAVPSAVMRVDARGQIVEVGAGARARFEFLVPGLSVLEAFSEHMLAGQVAEAIEAQAPTHFDVRLFADGRRTYRAAVEPYEVSGEREALLFLTDVSELVAYQELRSQFVANVSHELRTPLTGLRGLLEALGDPEMDPELHQRFVARAINETQRLEALIADILFLSELEATEGLPEHTASDLAEAARAAAGDLADAGADQSVDVMVHADAPVSCPLSERMAHTIARNLIENAIKYAGAGATAHVSVFAEDDRAVLSVTDDGAGIPERHLPHIFERFYRADASRSKRLGGTGLGLSIVKHIAERFGGDVSATSREGFGTGITVSLPLAPRRATDHAAGPGDA